MIKGQTSEEKVKNLLADCSFFKGVESHVSLPSTNDRGRALADIGAPEGTVILAEMQTAGRGRLGRRFYSPQSEGLYMSLILRPEKDFVDVGLITACAAVAAWQAIQQLTGIKVDIKWVNDLFYQNKKLCGILAEGQFRPSGELDYMILGVGINVTTPVGGYEEEIQNIAISLAEIADGSIIDKDALCAEFVYRFSLLYQRLPQTDFLEIYRAASCVLGEKVCYKREGTKEIAMAVDIDEKARLVVERENGEIEHLNSGEIHLLRTIL